MGEGINNWLKKAPVSINFEFSGIEFEDKALVTKHNEGNTNIVCDHGTIWDDSYTAFAYKGPEGYTLSLEFDTEATSPLWNTGTVDLIYNKKEDSWSIKASADGKEWKFCNPKVVVDVITTGLECYINDSETKVSHRNLFTSIVKSIKADKDNIIKGASLYAKEADCQTKEKNNPHIPDDSMQTW